MAVSDQAVTPVTDPVKGIGDVDVVPNPYYDNARWDLLLELSRPGLSTVAPEIQNSRAAILLYPTISCRISIPKMSRRPHSSSIRSTPAGDCLDLSPMIIPLLAEGCQREVHIAGVLSRLHNHVYDAHCDMSGCECLDVVDARR